MDTFVILREKRKEMGKTLQQVANEIGICMSMISKLENGKAPITPKIANMLNAYYNINIKPQDLKVVYEDYVPKKTSRFEILYNELNEENKALKKEIAKLYEALEQKEKIIECIKLAVDGEGTLSIRRKK